VLSIVLSILNGRVLHDLECVLYCMDILGISVHDTEVKGGGIS
jgi:hypothetical protein